MTLWNADLFEKLSAFAAEQHRAQYYPSALKLPYYLHLTQVCSRAMRAAIADPSLDINVIMACALLHDVLEDCVHSPEDEARISDFILNECGAVVLNGVRALSKQEILDSKGRKDKRAMMEDSLSRIKAQGKEVWAVKLADRISNLQEPPPHWTNDKKNSYLEEAQLIYQSLHAASPTLAQELLERMSVYQTHIER